MGIFTSTEVADRDIIQIKKFLTCFDFNLHVQSYKRE